MNIRSRGYLCFAVGVLAVTLGGRPASANTYSYGTNLGTLNYTPSQQVKSCQIAPNVNKNYTQINYSGFSYLTNQGITQPISGSTYYLAVGNWSGMGNCPLSGPGPSVFFNGTDGSGYTIQINPQNNNGVTSTLNVPGYVNPKYLVVGITYAPPGPQSFVDYTNSTLVSNTSTIKNSFTNTNSLEVSRMFSAGLLGWAGGTTTITASKTYQQETESSSSVTVSKQTTKSIQTPGPADPYTGLNHDFDIIWVWINPTVHFTLTNNGIVNNSIAQWDGYGFSSLGQQNDVNVIALYVGWLNGDIPMPVDTQQTLARTWAGTQTWPSGEGPGLTSSDLSHILAMDPYGQCPYNSAKTASTCPSPDPTRFTLTSNQDFLYQQPPPGGQPLTTTYQESYTNTTTLGQGASNTSTQAFGIETTYKGTMFGTGFTQSLKVTQTLQFDNSWNNQFTSSATSTATLSITGPPCNVVNSACSPVYPPASMQQTYGTAFEFDLYQDNLFGTFLLIPVQY